MARRERYSESKEDRLEMLNSYFFFLKKSDLLSAKEEKELFRKNEEYILTIFCELMTLDESWKEIERILDEMIETAVFPTEFFDITKADYEDLEKKSNFKRRKELASKIKMTIAKMVNYYKISNVFLQAGNTRKSREYFDKIAKLRESIGITLELIHHIKMHIQRVYNSAKSKNPEMVLKNEELRKIRSVLDKVNDISAKMREETNRIYSSNLRLAVTIAKRYHMKNMDLMEFIQEGNMVLAKAIEKFDWRRGTKFSTYAVPWLRQAIMRTMNDSIHYVRMPGHIVELLNKINKVMRNFFQENGRDPSTFEIAKILKVDPEKVEVVMKLVKEPIPFEENTQDNDDNTKVVDCIPQDWIYSDEVFDSLERYDIIKKIREVINTALSPKERKIIELRCGFLNGREATLDEVSELMSMTRERVRQIESRAMKKLKKALQNIKPLIFGKIRNGFDGKNKNGKA
ncbi:RNA polymerase sigma factor SigA [bacterium HR19]|nr:RNA polymerase sigma factor SigA [bacterium HR19]